MATLEQLLAERERRQGPSVQSLLAERDRRAAQQALQSDPAMQQGLADLSAMTRHPAVRNDQEPAPLMDGVEPVVRREDRSLGYRIADNILGIDDGYFSPGEKAGEVVNRAIEGATFGVVGDEANARAASVLRDDDYDERLQFYRDQEAQLKEENPVLAYGAELAGGMAVPGGAGAKLVSQAATRGGQLARAAGLGAAGAGTYGFMEGEGGAKERAANALFSAGAGALFGAAAPKITEAVAALPRSVQRLWKRSESRPTVEALRRIKNDAYDAVARSGEAFTGEETEELALAVRRVFEQGNYVEDVDNASRAVLTILERQGGRSVTLPQLDRIRQDMWARYNGAKDQPRILDAIAAVDELVESRAGSSALMDAARAANSRYAKSQLLEDAFTRATDQTASTGSGGNILNKYRQAVTSIINNPRKARFFSQDEITMMRVFVRGNMSENILRRVGKLSPNGNGLMMALHTVGGVISNGATLPAMAAGAGAKALADRSVHKGAEHVLDALAGVKSAVPALLDRRGVALGVGSASGAERTQEEIRNMMR